MNHHPWVQARRRLVTTHALIVPPGTVGDDEEDTWCRTCGRLLAVAPIQGGCDCQRPHAVDSGPADQ